MPAVYRLMLALVEQGCQIHWMMMGRDKRGRSTYDLLDGKIRVTCCQPPGAAWFDKMAGSKLRHLKFPQAAYMWSCLRRTLRLLRHTKVDLVYGAGPWGVTVAGIAAYMRRLPRVSRLYGSLLYFDRLRGRMEWLNSQYPWEVAVFKWPGDALIMTNDGTRCDLLAERFGTDPRKAFFLLNGVDKKVPGDTDAVRAAVRRRLGVPERSVMLATVSRLAPWKRVDRAIRAAAALQAQQLPCRLFIVGDGPSRPDWEALSHSSGAASLVTFLGELPHQEALEVLRSTDVFLSLYDFSNLGNPLIEAMVAGRCIVSLADGSLDGIITDGHDGILLEPETLESELPAQLAALIRDSELRQRLGASARRRAATTFWTWDERIAAETHIINTLCTGQVLDARRLTAEWATRRTNPRPASA
jgi:glycosyltransferase involved in cell wall biosynthesis